MGWEVGHGTSPTEARRRIRRTRCFPRPFSGAFARARHIVLWLLTRFDEPRILIEPAHDRGEQICGRIAPRSSITSRADCANTAGAAATAKLCGLMSAMSRGTGCRCCGCRWRAGGGGRSLPRGTRPRGAQWRSARKSIGAGVVRVDAAQPRAPVDSERARALLDEAITAMRALGLHPSHSEAENLQRRHELCPHEPAPMNLQPA